MHTQLFSFRCEVNIISPSAVYSIQITLSGGRMSYFFVKTVINNLCRAVKVFDNEELDIPKFVERGRIFSPQKHYFPLLSFENSLFSSYRA